MKRLFKNVYTFGLLGMLVMGILVFTQSAFKSDAKRVDTVYHFTGNNSDEINDPASWELTNSQDPACGSIGDLPCTISVPGNETLDSYVENTPAVDITANALSRKNASN